jgi:hypothetical protein
MKCQLQPVRTALAAALYIEEPKECSWSGHKSCGLVNCHARETLHRVTKHLCGKSAS